MSQYRAEARRRQFGRIDISLHFAQSDGRFSQLSIGMKNRISGILPALLNQTFIGMRSVFHEAVAIGVAVTVDPFQSKPDVRP